MNKNFFKLIFYFYIELILIFLFIIQIELLLSLLIRKYKRFDLILNNKLLKIWLDFTLQVFKENLRMPKIN